MNHSKDCRIFVAGHRGLVGSAIVQSLREQGFKNIITKGREELDLLDYKAVENFFANNEIEYVFLAAAKVGGIFANDKYRADFIYQNLSIQNNVIFNAYKFGVKKLLFLGSSCIYPKNASQPISEDSLLSGELEYTNEPYAIAKIAGMKMCESFNLQYGTNFISIMPTNLYGNNDNFNLFNSHVLPALIRKIHLAKLLSQNKTQEVYENLKKDCAKSDKEAQMLLETFMITPKSVGIWGSGKPRREFLHSRDMAEASIFIMQNVDFKDLINSKEVRNTHINVGYGKDISIYELAELVKEIIGFEGDIILDNTKPDGTYQKLMNIEKLEKLGFKPKISLRDGIKEVYQNYIK